MLKTASVTQLRADLAAYLERVDEGPVVVMSGSQPAAVLLDPQVYESLIETAQTLEDVAPRAGASAIARSRGHGDDFCAVWPLFELLQAGAAGWASRL